LARHSPSCSPDDMPAYFRYLTLLAFHTFLQEGVETAIVECGIGGEYDSTNIMPPEAVTVSAITQLGIDHTGMLGETIGDIAWHKAGILKSGVPAYTVEQSAEAQAVLQRRAEEKRVELKVVKRLANIDQGKVHLGMEGDFQTVNASLAAVVAASHLDRLGTSDPILTAEKILAEQMPLPQPFVHGLEAVKWPGRCQTLKDGNIEWLLDGAHTNDSIEAAAQWYLSKVQEAYAEENPPTATMLIFNQQERDGLQLLQKLMTTCLQSGTLDMFIHVFTYAAFCTNTPFQADAAINAVDLEPQEKMANKYQLLDSNVLHMVFGSIEEAVALARRVSEGDERVLVFVTGSLHLVGGLLKVLGRDASDEARKVC